MEEQGIHIHDADLSLAQAADHARDLTRTFVQLDGEDVGKGDGDTGALQFDVGPLGIHADDPEQSVLGRVCDRRGNDAYMRLLEEVENLRQALP